MASRVHFRYRTYQWRAREARRAGCKRFVQVLHRRAGKDRSWLAITLEAMLERVGVYFHVFPSLNQGRRDLWDNIVHERDPDTGREVPIKMMDMFPPELVVEKNETEMQITLINGSKWQIMGADDEKAIDRLRGPNPIGIVFSEYSFMKKEAWTTLSPVLAENGGWAVFIYTPKDKTHGYEMYTYARQSRDWFCELLTIDQTRRDAAGEDGSPVIRLDEIEELRRTKSVTEEDIQREYFCSFEGFLHGTIWGDLVAAARAEGRIRPVPYTVNMPVGACFDIGVTDMTAIWFYQTLGQAIMFIDYHEENLKTAQYFAKLLRDEKRYLYGRMILPWDARWSAGDYFTSVGFRGVTCAEKKPIQVGIDKVREYFPRFYFDESKCARGITCIEKYARPWDNEKKSFGITPIHDEYSHGASALRTGAVGEFGPVEFYEGQGQEVKVETTFDPREPAYTMRRD